MPSLGAAVLGELLTMSREEFGFAGGDDGRITLPCDASVMEYAMCLLRRDASEDVERAFLSSIARPSCYNAGSQQSLAVCGKCSFPDVSRKKLESFLPIHS
uniref:Auxin-responsive protein n=1 Tax=Oryza brachyantha TaxID=4533 RepID=J3MZT7_ORYBR